MQYIEQEANIRQLLASDVLRSWAEDRVRLRRTLAAVRADNLRTRIALKALMRWLHRHHLDAASVFRQTGADAVSKLFIIWPEAGENSPYYLTHAVEGQFDLLDSQTRFPMCAGELNALATHPPPESALLCTMPRRPNLRAFMRYTAARRLAKKYGPFDPFAAEAALESTVDVFEGALSDQPKLAESLAIASLVSMQYGPQRNATPTVEDEDDCSSA